ncbi:MAG: hypothetical protein GWP14_02940 [Actinobacteria bacterium]|nr:hypothetical protein [Actinomycetota bacterium]
MFRNGEFGPQLVLLDQGRLLVQQRWIELLIREGLGSFQDFMSTDKGEILGQRADRVRMRIKLDSPEGKKVFYLKRYDRSGWIRRLLMALGVCSRSRGRRELNNIYRLQKAGLATLVAAAAGESGVNEGSFILVEELSGYQPLHEFLESFLAESDRTEMLRGKRELAKALAKYVRRLHAAGMDHRDLYLCHFFLRPEEPVQSLRLIDLQRIKRSWGLRQRHGFIKDLAALNYSADHSGISRTDRLRFALEYFGTRRPDLRQRLFLRAVVRKTRKIGRHHRKTQINNGGTSS